MTPAQKWARKRNFNKFRFSGVLYILKSLRQCSNVLTSDEEEKLKQAERALEDILHWWKDQTKMSKKMYVKEV